MPNHASLVLLIAICLRTKITCSETDQRTNQEIIKNTVSFLRKSTGTYERRGLHVECPWPRHKPSLMFVKRELQFPSECCNINDKFATECPLDEHMCLKEFILPLGLRKWYSMSLLLKVECNEAKKMQVLGWKGLQVDAMCSQDDLAQLVIQYQGDLYKLTFKSTDDDVNLIIENIKNASDSRISVTVNGEELEPSSKTDGVPSHDDTAVHIGYRDRAETDSGIDMDECSLVGTLKAFDVFSGNSLREYRKQEYQYMRLLTMDAEYPECTCSPSEIDGSGDICTSGESRIPGCSNGSQNLDLQSSQTTPRYGIWHVYPHTELLVTLGEPSRLTEFEMQAEKIDFTVYHSEMAPNDDIKWIELFDSSSIQNPRRGIVSSKCYSKKWSDDRDGRVYKFKWTSSSSKITGSLYVLITDGDSSAGNMIYDLILRGRPLSGSRTGDKFWCFPGNTDQEGELDAGCKMCLCRTSTGNITNRQCKPVIESVEPRQGPVSGGTVIEIKGHLLTPEFNQGNLLTTIYQGKHNLCEHNIKRNDTHIICKASPGNEGLIGILQRVEVNILVGGAFYKLETREEHTYQYRPDPVIKDINPYKSFSKGLVLTVTGKHFDSMNIFQDAPQDLMFLTFQNRNMKVPCISINESSMMCTVPATNTSDATLEAYVGFNFDGCMKYKNMTDFQPQKYGKFKIFPTPRIHRSEVTMQNTTEGIAVAKLQGEHLDSGCGINDYVVMVGGKRCPIYQLNSSYLMCYLPDYKHGIGKYFVMVKVYDYIYDVGYLHFAQEVQKEDKPIGIIIGILSAAILLTLLAAVMISKRRQDSQLQLLLESGNISPAQSFAMEIAQEKTSSAEGVNSFKDSLLKQLPINVQQTIESFIVDHKLLQLMQVIGKGHFGTVHMGLFQQEYCQNKVAVKTLKENAMVNATDAGKFLMEAIVMRNFNHPHILSLIGLAFDDSKCFVILPYMDNGDLRSYVSKKDFSTPTFTELLVDVAKGMEYLTQHKYVHRDLAARNCMVDVRECVLIGDFGLARDLYESDYYRPDDKKCPLPIKWMSPESIELEVFTSKSDVWAFGILMWEVFSKGTRPYSAVENFNMLRFLTLGNRLNKPDNCPQELYLLMRRCWKDEPRDRPLFSILVTELQRMSVTFARNECMKQATNAQLTAKPVTSMDENEGYLQPQKCMLDHSEPEKAGQDHIGSEEEVQKCNTGSGKPLADDKTPVPASSSESRMDRYIIERTTRLAEEHRVEGGEKKYMEFSGRLTNAQLTAKPVTSMDEKEHNLQPRKCMLDHSKPEKAGHNHIGSEEEVQKCNTGSGKPLADDKIPVPGSSSVSRMDRYIIERTTRLAEEHRVEGREKEYMEFSGRLTNAQLTAKPVTSMDENEGYHQLRKCVLDHSQPEKAGQDHIGSEEEVQKCNIGSGKPLAEDKIPVPGSSSKSQMDRYIIERITRLAEEHRVEGREKEYMEFSGRLTNAQLTAKPVTSMDEKELNLQPRKCMLDHSKPEKAGHDHIGSEEEVQKCNTGSGKPLADDKIPVPGSSSVSQMDRYIIERTTRLAEEHRVEGREKEYMEFSGRLTNAQLTAKPVTSMDENEGYHQLRKCVLDHSQPEKAGQDHIGSEEEVQKCNIGSGKPLADDKIPVPASSSESPMDRYIIERITRLAGEHRVESEEKEYILRQGEAPQQEKEGKGQPERYQQ